MRIEETWAGNQRTKDPIYPDWVRNSIAWGSSELPKVVRCLRPINFDLLTQKVCDGWEPGCRIPLQQLNRSIIVGGSDEQCEFQVESWPGIAFVIIGTHEEDESVLGRIIFDFGKVSGSVGDPRGTGSCGSALKYGREICSQDHTTFRIIPVGWDCLEWRKAEGDKYTLENEFLNTSWNAFKLYRQGCQDPENPKEVRGQPLGEWWAVKDWVRKHYQRLQRDGVIADAKEQWNDLVQRTLPIYRSWYNRCCSLEDIAAAEGLNMALAIAKELRAPKESLSGDLVERFADPKAQRQQQVLVRKRYHVDDLKQDITKTADIEDWEVAAAIHWDR